MEGGQRERELCCVYSNNHTIHSIYNVTCVLYDCTYYCIYDCTIIQNTSNIVDGTPNPRQTRRDGDLSYCCLFGSMELVDSSWRICLVLSYLWLFRNWELVDSSWKIFLVNSQTNTPTKGPANSTPPLSHLEFLSTTIFCLFPSLVQASSQNTTTTT